MSYKLKGGSNIHLKKLDVEEIKDPVDSVNSHDPHVGIYKAVSSKLNVYTFSNYVILLIKGSTKKSK